MQRQILVPLDGSALAETILPHAARMAHATHGTLILLRVIPLPIITDPLTGAVPGASGAYDSWETDAAEAHDYLTSVIERLDLTALPIQTVVLEGEPASTIVTYAQERAEGLLIAMATHGRSGLGRWVFGSVAERVLHAAPAPLLLARPPVGQSVVVDLNAPYRHILIPLDGSPLAAQALDPARQLAAALDTTIHLAAVVPVRDDRAAAVAGVVAPHLSQASQHERTQLEHYLATTAAGLVAEGLRVEKQVLYGHPAEAILRESEYAEADLIVMATHGRSGLQKLWLGSVALKVTQGTVRPVLLVRAQAEAVRVPDPVASNGRVALPVPSHS